MIFQRWGVVMPICKQYKFYDIWGRLRSWLILSSISEASLPGTQRLVKEPHSLYLQSSIMEISFCSTDQEEQLGTTWEYITFIDYT